MKGVGVGVGVTGKVGKGVGARGVRVGVARMYGVKYTRGMSVGKDAGVEVVQAARIRYRIDSPARLISFLKKFRINRLY
jgi:hypothetical protein